eukprot:1161182-Pelagomonas_calceolata.AAC.10
MHGPSSECQALLCCVCALVLRCCALLLHAIFMQQQDLRLLAALFWQCALHCVIQVGRRGLLQKLDPFCKQACAFLLCCRSHHILEAPRTTSAAKAAAKHAPTPPQPFNFITDDRLQRRHQQQQQQQHQQQQEESFKALPLNRALLDHPVCVCARAFRCFPKMARCS